MKDKYRSLRKAAVLVASLDAERARAVLAQMSPTHAAVVRKPIDDLGQLDPAEQEQVIEEFFRIGPLVPDREPSGIDLVDPRSLVPESVMPAYAFLAEKPLRVADTAQHLLANRAVGVPYTDDMVANAEADLRAQADPEADREGLLARYPHAAVGELDGRPGELTEMDALVAYLQVLGRMVDFDQVTPADLRQ